MLSAGLPPGEGLVHPVRLPGLPMSPLVVPGSALLTVRHLRSQSGPPETWLEAVGELGFADHVFITRPRPQGGEPGAVETLAAFTSDEDATASGTHAVLPARRLRG